MARRHSAGILLFRRRSSVEVLLVHPGGPFWAGRDAGAWSIPKGEFDEVEPPADAARREFAEETGQAIAGDLLALPPIEQSRGKTVYPFAVEGDFDPAEVASNTFAIEWPPRSGRVQVFPEIDRAAWFTLDDARAKMVAGQRPMLEALRERLGLAPPTP